MSGQSSGPQPTYKGEVQLLRWGESGSNGMTVTLALDDGPDGYTSHPFKPFHSGKANGQRFMAVLVPIGDDEEPMAKPLPPTTIKPVKPNQREAGMLCRDLNFMTWIGATTPEEAAEKLRSRCGVSSRRELDEGAPAARYADLIWQYSQWYSAANGGDD